MTVDEIHRGEIEELQSELRMFRDICYRLRAALEHYGQHTYACTSEHGRFRTRCSCGFHAALELGKEQ